MKVVKALLIVAAFILGMSAAFAQSVGVGGSSGVSVGVGGGSGDVNTNTRAV
jgi:hypothetical protein